MPSQLGALATCAAILLCLFLRRCRRPSAILDIPGPENPSWIFGMFRKVNLIPSTTPYRSTALNVKEPKDTSGIS